MSQASLEHSFLMKPFIIFTSSIFAENIKSFRRFLQRATRVEITNHILHVNKSILKRTFKKALLKLNVGYVQVQKSLAEQGQSTKDAFQHFILLKKSHSSLKSFSGCCQLLSPAKDWTWNLNLIHCSPFRCQMAQDKQCPATNKN